MRRFQPKIMGILNVTPDSHYDGGLYANVDTAIRRGIEMVNQGAAIIDVGGESTRPGSDPVSEKEELRRVIPVIGGLKDCIPKHVMISIDTMKPAVAEAALAAGATFINDVSGFRDPSMVAVAAKAKVPVCVMHMQGTPKTMQLNPVYEEGVVPHLIGWIKERTAFLTHHGINPKNIIFDPGIGFGKTVDNIIEILHNLQRFRSLGFPVLLGLSRKSFMTKILGKPPSELMAATLALSTVALMANVDIIRVYDVAEHRDIINVLRKYLSYKNPQTD